MSVYCPQCGAPSNSNTGNCEYCGAAIPQHVPQYQQPPQYQQAPQQNIYVQQNDPRQNWPVKSKVAAGLLALFLGGLGVHKFYLGQTGLGVVYLLFCWTCIPAFIALIDAIIILCSSDENFEIKYRVRNG